MTLTSQGLPTFSIALDYSSQVLGRYDEYWDQIDKSEYVLDTMAAKPVLSSIRALKIESADDLFNEDDYDIWKGVLSGGSSLKSLDIRSYLRPEQPIEQLLDECQACQDCRYFNAGMTACITICGDHTC